MHSMEDKECTVPASQNRSRLADTEVVDDSFEILSVGFGDVGGIVERLVANALTTNIIANLSKVK